MAQKINKLNYPVPDINEEVLQKVGETYGIKHLSPAKFSSEPYPVQGYNYNDRSMLPLVCQLGNGPSVNIWFMLITGVSFTSITKKSMEALGGSDKKDQFLLSIQEENSQIECEISTNDHEEINVLGWDALCSMRVALPFKNGCYHLIKDEL